MTHRAQHVAKIRSQKRRDLDASKDGQYTLLSESEVTKILETQSKHERLTLAQEAELKLAQQQGSRRERL